MNKKILKLLENNNKNKPHLYIITTIALSFIFGWGLTYFSGGTKYSWLHIIYIPIILSAFFYKDTGGFIGGIIAGIIIGPMMPLDTEMHISQPDINWISRTFFFVIFGTFFGFVFKIIFNYFERQKSLIYYDQITGLPNQESLKEDIKEKVKKESNFSLIALGIENYFEILNTIGYDYAEELLRSITHRLKVFMPRYMKLYNPYDNKFIILVEDHSNSCMDWLYKFSYYLSDSIDFQEVPIHIKVHLGVLMDAQKLGYSNEILRTVFITLNNAVKKDVPYLKYNEVMNKNRLKNMRLLGEVKKAIKENQFELYYQPKIDIKSKKIIGAEALIRWNHPKTGFVNPGDFIPQVEKTHLITPLTYWVFHRSIHDMIETKKKGLDIKVAINISAKSFQSKNFIKTIKNVLKNHDLNSGNFEFELTERDIMKSKESTFRNIQEIRDIGINVSIDDFGTGYSSLSYLNSLPANIIKIDRAFITDLDKDDQKREITNATIIMGHALGKEIVAEGIESKEELKLLENMGCEYAQGYYLSKPLPFNDFLDFLEKDSLDIS